MNATLVWTRHETAIDITPPKLGNEFNFNPSITRHKGELFVSFRGYRKSNASFRAYTSPLTLGKLKDDKVSNFKEMKPRNAPEYVKECGIEDVRLWSDGENLYGIGVLLSRFPNGRLNVRLGEILIDYENGAFDLIKDFGQPYRVPEKNWSPIEGRPHQYMYGVDKLYAGGKISLTTRRNTVEQRLIHGGTQLVKINGGYISIVHQRTRLANGMGCYPNMFVKYDDNLVPTGNTDWFVFKDYKDEEVQFMSGMVLLDDETLGITVGLDRVTARKEAQYKALLYKVKLDDIGFQRYGIIPLRNGRYIDGDK